MPSFRNLVSLHGLRQHRRLIAVTLLFTLTAWLAILFTQCLPLSTAATPCATMSMAADTGSGNAMDDASCSPSVCAATGDRSLLGYTIASSADLKVWSVLLFVVAALLLTLSIPRKIPLPSPLLLPKRPRTLKFYALRI